MPLVAGGAILGGSLISGLFGASSADKAAKAQADAARQAAQLEQQRYNTTRGDLSPYNTTGQGANNALGNIYGLNGQGAQNAAYQNFQASPGYQWNRDQALNAVNSRYAANGFGVGGGGVLKALQDRASGLANSEWGNYTGGLQNLQGVGENAAAMTGSLGMQGAAQQGQDLQNVGAAQAGGYLGQANAINGAISNGLQLYGYGKGQGWFNSPPNSGGGGPYPAIA